MQEKRLRTLWLYFLLYSLVQSACIAAFSYSKQVQDWFTPKFYPIAAVVEETARTFTKVTGWPSMIIVAKDLPKEEITKRDNYHGDIENAISEHHDSGLIVFRESTILSYISDPRVAYAEFVYFAKEKDLQLVLYTDHKLKLKPVAPALQYALVTYGTIPQQPLVPTEIIDIDLSAINPEALRWRSTAKVDFSEIQKKISEMLTFSFAHVRTFNYASDEFTQQVRDAASNNIRAAIVSSKIFGLPMSLSMLAVGLMALQIAHSRYLKRKMAPMARSIYRELGEYPAIPNLISFAFTRDLDALEEQTLEWLRNRRRELYDKRALEGTEANLQQRLTALSERLNGKHPHGEIVSAALNGRTIEQMREAIRLLRQTEQTLAEQQQSAVRSNGAARTNGKPKSGGGGGGRKSNKPHLIRSLVTGFGRTSEAAEHNETLERRFKEIMPVDEIVEISGDLMDPLIFQVLACVLIAPGSNGSRFNACYHDNARVFQRTAAKYRAWHSRDIDRELYDKTVDYLLNNNVLCRKPKSGGDVYSLNAKASTGREKIAQALIAQILMAADMMSSQQNV